MAYTLKSTSAIYLQLADSITRDICSGVLLPGQQITPVRELAISLGVNPNTVQRALSTLEESGLVHTQSTSGRYVTEDISLIAQHRKRLATQITHEYTKALATLGCSRNEILMLIAETEKTYG